MDRGGFTLLELLLVVLLLSVAAAVVIPSLSPLGPEKVEAAAAEVADALRFARDEALRTGQVHGVRVLGSGGRVTVYRSNGAASPPFVGEVLYHPVSKQPYDLLLGERPATAGVGVSATPFLYRGDATSRDEVLFAPAGNPVAVLGGVVRQLQNGRIDLSSGGFARSVLLTPIVGRVVVQ